MKKTTKKTPKQTGKIKPRKIRISKVATDMTTIRKPQEYLEFITFMAIPKVLREETMGVKSQQDFGKKYRVDEDTLCAWKNKVGFWDDVVTARKDFFRQRTADVILALETKSLDPERVQGTDVKVLLGYTGEYAEKVENEHKVHPDIQAALDRISRVLG